MFFIYLCGIIINASLVVVLDEIICTSSIFTRYRSESDDGSNYKSLSRYSTTRTTHHPKRRDCAADTRCNIISAAVKFRRGARSRITRAGRATTEANSRSQDTRIIINYTKFERAVRRDSANRSPVLYVNGAQPFSTGDP